MKTSEKMKPDCKQTKKMAWEYLEGRFNQDKGELIEEHLKECPGCQMVYNKIQLMMDTVQEQKNLKSSPFLTTRILNRLDEGEITAGKSYFLLKHIWRSVAVAIVILTGIITGRLVSDQLLSVNESEIFTDTGMQYTDEPFLAEADYYVPAYEFLNEER